MKTSKRLLLPASTALALAASTFALVTSTSAPAHAKDDTSSRSEFETHQSGNLVGWGGNTQREQQIVTMPENATRYTQVALAGYRTLLLTDTNEVVVIGDKRRAQEIPDLPQGARHWTSLTASDDLTIGVTDDNRLVTFDVYEGAKSQQIVTLPPGASSWAKIAVDHRTALALTNDGQIVPLGDTDNGRGSVPPLPSGAQRWTDVDITDQQTMLLTDDGRVVLTGYYTSSRTPVLPAGSTRFTAVALDLNHTLALTDDGQIVALGQYSQDAHVVPPLPASATRYTAIAAGYNHSVALTDTGEVVTFGQGVFNAPLVVPDLPSGATHWTHVDATNQRAMAIADNGEIVFMGPYPIAADVLPQHADLSHLTKVSSLSSTTVALAADGSIHSAGSNHNDQRRVPSLPTGASRWTDIAAGSTHTLALTDTGEVVSFGELTTAPALPHGAGRFVTIAAGGDFSLGLSDNGMITTANTPYVTPLSIPALPTGASRWSKITAGGTHALALTNDGQIVGFGTNQSGEIDIPELPSGATRWTAIDAGWYLSLAMTDDGQIVSFGENRYGEDVVPELPAGATRWIDMAAGDNHALALSDTGDVVGFGNPLSRRTTAPKLAPGMKYIAVEAGSEHSLALVGPVDTQPTYAAPTITGKAEFGSILTATAGAPIAGTALANAGVNWTWAANGTTIPGATDATFTPAEAQIGSTITATATHVAPGAESVARTSTATAVVTPATFTSPAVLVAGTAKVGAELTAVAFSTPTAGSIDWEWKRGSTVVSTTATYTPTKADADHALSVTATLKRAGHTSVTARTTVDSLASSSAPTLTLTSSKQTVRQGQKVTLTWRTRNSTSTQGSWTPKALKASGKSTLAPKAGRRVYTVTARNTKGSTTATIVVNVGLPNKALKVVAQRQLAAGTSFTAKVTGLRAGERFTLRYGSKKITGKATKKGAARATFTTRTDLRNKRTKVIATGSHTGRKASAIVRVIR